MEHFIAFILGITLVILIREAVIIFKQPNPNQEILDKIDDLYNELDSLDQDLNNFINNFDKIEERIHRRIDGEIDRTNKLFNRSIDYTSSQVGELESKITDNNGAKQILNG